MKSTGTDGSWCFWDKSVTWVAENKTTFYLEMYRPNKMCLMCSPILKLHSETSIDNWWELYTKLFLWDLMNARLPYLTWPLDPKWCHNRLSASSCMRLPVAIGGERFNSWTSFIPGAFLITFNLHFDWNHRRCCLNKAMAFIPVEAKLTDICLKSGGSIEVPCDLKSYLILASKFLTWKARSWHRRQQKKLPRRK